MNLGPRARSYLLLVVFVVAGCGRDAAKETVQVDPPKTQAATVMGGIPGDNLDAVLAAHLKGLGAMERYEYSEAAEAFRSVRKLAPAWNPGAINLAISLLNLAGKQSEEAKASGGNEKGGFDEALALLDEVIGRDPNNLNAHYCRGLILEYLGQDRTPEAHKEFQIVVDRDPTDGHAWLKLGSTLSVPDEPGRPAGPAQAEKLIELFSKALECNPNLVTALYRLQQAYGWARKPEKQRELLDRWRRLNPKSNPAGSGDTAEAFYGESGKYAVLVDPLPFHPKKTPTAPAPKFDAPETLKVQLPEGDRWAKADDFTGPSAFLGRARARFGATIATFDVNGDGHTDVFLAAAVAGPKGLRDALLLNKGDGTFEDVSSAWGLTPDRPSLGVAAGDFDADRRADLFVTGRDGYRLLHNAGTSFEDVTAKAGMDKVRVLGLTARWLDLDQDGDLDLFVVNHTDLDSADKAFGDDKVPGAANAAFRNDGTPPPVKGRPQDNWAPLAAAPPDLTVEGGLSLVFTPWPKADEWLGPPARYSALAAADFDDDRDLDLVVASDDDAPRVVLNDRLGAFHAQELTGGSTEGLAGLLVADFDKDGHADLALTRPGGRLTALRNATDLLKSPRVVAFSPFPSNAASWSIATAADVDLDTWPDLVGLRGAKDGRIEWARNTHEQLDATALPLGPAPDAPAAPTGFALADLVADPLPDVLISQDGAAPRLAKNLGNGQHWLALDLAGRWKTSFDQMRTNSLGIGTRITLEGQGLLVAHDHTTPSTSLAQSIGPVVLGLGENSSVELLRLRWPDGTMQCELNQTANTLVALAEYNRKTGSCPVLFTWNGERFVCLGDFLGGGGLGYLVAPGVYGQPDRDESVAIAPDQLRAVDGVFRLSVTEPMDEVAYLDQLRLVVVDRPPGVSSTPDERFAPQGPRPTGESIAWTRAIEPEKATDLKGQDVSKALQAWDRDTVDGFRRRNGWIGYAEEHGIVLDFGDRLREFGPNDRLTLVLAGWVEYPYSQTNYAAATAGVALNPPTIERRNADGTWTEIAPEAGYPAGLPRMTTLDLTGKLTGPTCVIRLRTNMECYWDQAFVAIRDANAEAALRQTTLPVARARLAHRGYTREVSPDGRQPLLYDYDHVDPAPLALMQGRLTRHGDVQPLLMDDDDQLCLVGPGDEVRLEFDAAGLPDLPEGWTRSYVLKAVGYCKDADPFTATSDRVEPLPWRDMPAFPFDRPAERPADPAYRTYLDTYQTRPAGGR